ncbi:unnamed protein product [Cladocopium goreaui]|uniref:Uncharacterized protein n=1 Tax=Cladocopium goreaui TaxID=2562237 RepID=A0A9P1GH80_9DINO|nr:unnamed protein product [Cladocopium goreaui]
MSWMDLAAKGSKGWTGTLENSLTQSKAAGQPSQQIKLAALLIVGHARSLPWMMVCENIKMRLVDALLKDQDQPPQWKVEVGGGLPHRYVKQMMQPCIELLNPVYVNFMPAVYPQPGNCSMRSARSFSQCRRLDVALDYVLDSFQLEHGRFYEAFIKVRPDAIYLKDVPPMWSFNLSRVAMSAGGYGLQLASKDCRVAGLRCTSCHVVPVAKDHCDLAVLDKVYFDGRVHTVLARIMNRSESSFNRSFTQQFLHLDCDRWTELIRKRAPAEYRVGSGLCGAEAERFRNAEPPRDTEGTDDGGRKWWLDSSGCRHPHLIPGDKQLAVNRRIPPVELDKSLYQPYSPWHIDRSQGDEDGWQYGIAWNTSTWVAVPGPFDMFRKRPGW